MANKKFLLATSAIAGFFALNGNPIRKNDITPIFDDKNDAVQLNSISMPGHVYMPMTAIGDLSKQTQGTPFTDFADLTTWIGTNAMATVISGSSFEFIGIVTGSGGSNKFLSFKVGGVQYYAAVTTPGLPV